MEQISSKHKADTSGEEHERSRSETSSPGLSATSATTDLFDSDPTSRSMKPVPDTNSADQTRHVTHFMLETFRERHQKTN